VNRAAERDNIAFRWSAEIQEIVGRGGVEAVQLVDRQTGEVETLPCDAVFAYVGLAPNSEWLGDLVDRDAGGAVSTGSTLETRAAGVFAVGALRSGYAGRLTSAVGEATEAAIRVSAMLEA
jgi:thioredoxin reductase (NADPH)